MVLLISILIASMTPDTPPADVVDTFFDALEARDGLTAYDCLAGTITGQLQMGLMMVRSDVSGETLEEMCTDLGMQVTLAELDTITPREFGARLLSSDLVYGEAIATQAVCGETEITGDTAFVAMTYTGKDAGSDTLRLVVEDGCWRLLIGTF